MNLKICIVLLFFSGFAKAASIDAAFESRIANACINSVEVGGKKIRNYRVVCKCIGETHFRSALQEPKQQEAEEHINWTAEFYETSDMKRLQRLVGQNPKFSSFDDQVVADCMESANRGPKK